MTKWLMLRGFTRDQRHWGAFPDQFAQTLGVEVLAMDPPGFGSQNGRPSPTTISAITDDIRARLDRGTESWSILGISMGGMVALDWCARFPDEFQKCVVINSSTAASLPHHRFNPAAIPEMIVQRFRSGESRERSILSRIANSKTIDLDAIARDWMRFAEALPPHRSGIINQSRAVRGFRMPKTFEVPLLVLASRADRLVSYRTSELIAKRLDGELRLHSTAGHDLPLDDGPWICEQVEMWLK